MPTQRGKQFATSVVAEDISADNVFQKLSHDVSESIDRLTLEEHCEELDFFLDSTHLDETSKTAWRMDIMVQNKVQFKVDTGAEVTALSEAAWKTLRDVPALSPTKKLLGGPDRVSWV